jgi:hypothetical protein
MVWRCKPLTTKRTTDRTLVLIQGGMGIGGVKIPSGVTLLQELLRGKAALSASCASRRCRHRLGKPRSEIDSVERLVDG